MANEYNPIKTVDGETVKCPSVYQYYLQDISAADAGRTEDTVMDKMRIGQCVKLALEWHNIDLETCSDILTKFNPEYITVCYLDAMSGSYKTSEFYVGDRSAPMYNCRSVLWSNLAFDLIERSGL